MFPCSVFDNCSFLFSFSLVDVETCRAQQRASSSTAGRSAP